MEEILTKTKPWLNILLFVLTIGSAFFVGISWSLSFTYGEGAGRNFPFDLGGTLFQSPHILFLSVLYAAVLIIILLGHELGHYLACRRYHIDATLPYFIPAPTLIGTLGAFIKIKSPITRKQQLFDIGVAGPLAGFILSVPALVVGLALSKAVPAMPREEAMVFGEPLLLKIIGGLLFKDAPPGSDILLHPVAFAGWVGILVTAYNLFPMGQLDGGHIFFAMMGRKAATLGKILLGVFVVMGVFFWVGWFVWALLILLLGLKHPRIIDEEVPLSRGRKAIGALIIVIFVLSFIPDPVKGFDLFSLLKQFGL
ncbi:MAG: site-2 protease family protein [Candidatus Aminicenantales bacterium]